MGLKQKKDSKGFTPLHIAAIHGSKSCLAHADPGMRTVGEIEAWSTKSNRKVNLNFPDTHADLAGLNPLSWAILMGKGRSPLF